MSILFLCRSTRSKTKINACTNTCPGRASAIVRASGCLKVRTPLRTLSPAECTGSLKQFSHGMILQNVHDAGWLAGCHRATDEHEVADGFALSGSCRQNRCASRLTGLSECHLVDQVLKNARLRCPPHGHTSSCRRSCDAFDCGLKDVNKRPGQSRSTTSHFSNVVYLSSHAIRSF